MSISLKKNIPGKYHSIILAQMLDNTFCCGIFSTEIFIFEKILAKE